ncbi:MAG: hypothetical protein Kow0031_09320 [Anaerolineae bacterium]
MIKVGLGGAVVALIYMMGLTLLFPFCTVCLTPLLGLTAGYLTAWVDKPLRAESGVMGGVVAGLLTGVGAIAGQIMAALVSAVLVTNWEELPKLMNEFGFPQLATFDSTEYWQTTLFVNSFCGVFNLALIVGLGAAGSLLWFQRNNKNSLSTLSS